MKSFDCFSTTSFLYVSCLVFANQTFTTFPSSKCGVVFTTLMASWSLVKETKANPLKVSDVRRKLLFERSLINLQFQTSPKVPKY